MASDLKPDLKPELDGALDDYDRSHDAGELRLDTGMKVREVVERAMFWWENRGRAIVREHRVPGNKGAAFFIPNPKTREEAFNSFPSGIMRAVPWTDLDRDEKLRVAKWWHHFAVRVGALDPEEYLRERAVEGKCFYCDDPSMTEETLPNGEIREMCINHFADRYPVETKQYLELLEAEGEA